MLRALDAFLHWNCFLEANALIFFLLARALLDYVISSPGVYEFYHTETPVDKRGQGLAAIVTTVRCLGALGFHL